MNNKPVLILTCVDAAARNTSELSRDGWLVPDASSLATRRAVAAAAAALTYLCGREGLMAAGPALEINRR